jgi:hypothetical protein
MGKQQKSEKLVNPATLFVEEPQGDLVDPNALFKEPGTTQVKEEPVAKKKEKPLPTIFPKFSQAVPTEEEISEKGLETIVPPNAGVSFQEYKDKLNDLQPGLGNESINYNLKSAWEAGSEPTLGEDQKFHLPSRNPLTGELLKGPGHPTFNKMISEEIKLGNEVYKKGDKYFSRESLQDDIPSVGVKVDPETNIVPTFTDGLLVQEGQEEQPLTFNFNPLLDDQTKEIFRKTIVEKQKQGEIEENDSSFFWGAVKSFNNSLAGNIRGVGNAIKIMEDAVAAIPDINLLSEEERQPPITSADLIYGIADGIDEVTKDNPDVPNTIVGNVVGGLSSIAPDLVFAAGAPEVKLPTWLSRMGLTKIPKFATYLGVKEYLDTYVQELKTEPDEFKKLYKSLGAGAKGFEEGLLFHSLGFTAGEISKLASKLGAGEVATAATGGVANGALFGGYNALEQFLSIGEIDPRTGKVKTEVDMDEVWTNAGIGLGFSGKEMMTAITNSARTKVMSNFYSAPNSVIEKINQNPIDQYKAREASQKLWEQAEKETDPAKKKEMLMAKTAIDNMIDVQAMSKDILLRPEEVIESINTDETLSQKEKDTYTDKVQRVVDNSEISNKINISKKQVEKRERQVNVFKHLKKKKTY